ncbi:DUF305 domain-containing protein [Helicobacter sp. MIT 11-5569]|uniref:DUF305 domain-containing protein n=1 Tax=Helicobacter sp. MIT 11-5569 TaxID=1548151 RepID=UPI00051FE8D9|nr:DUF305 domain-containing protein [Helicobacter sp. MIT 11-5569]
MKTMTYSLILAAALASVALAQPQHHSSHSSMQMPHNTQGISATIIQSMHQPMIENATIKSGSADRDFLSNMIPHHQGAILSSEVLLEVPNLDPKIRKIAENIITTQEEEIKFFNSLLNTESFLENSNKKAYENFCNASQKAMDSMMKEMNKVYDNNPQKTFLAGMIPHHQGAVIASKEILKITNNATIKKIAENIIKAQEQEIAEMENLLKGME